MKRYVGFIGPRGPICRVEEDGEPVRPLTVFGHTLPQLSYAKCADHATAYRQVLAYAILLDTTADRETAELWHEDVARALIEPCGNGRVCLTDEMVGDYMVQAICQMMATGELPPPGDDDLGEGV